MNTDTYDVNARAAQNVAFEQARPLLQKLLEDRFKLVVRHETREMVQYELLPDKSGLKVGPSKGGSCVAPSPEISRNRLTCASILREYRSLFESDRSVRCSDYSVRLNTVRRSRPESDRQDRSHAVRLYSTRSSLPMRLTAHLRRIRPDRRSSSPSGSNSD